MIKQTLISETTCRVTCLPFGIVEVVVRTPDREGRLLSSRRFRSHPQHAIEWFHTLKIKYVTIAHREQNVPRGAQGVECQRCLPVDRSNLKNALNRQRSNQALPVRAAGIALIEIIGGAHPFPASRVSEQADVTEIDLAHQIIQSGRWSFGAGIPPAQLLQMTEHQPAARQVQAAINESAGCSVDAAVHIEGHNDVAQTRQTLCQVTVSGVTRHGNEAGRTGAGKGVLNVDIKMLAGSGQTTTSGVIAMQQNQKCV